MSTTLFCYDGSDSAVHALQVTHDTLGRGPLTLLYVWTPPPAVLADAFGVKSNGGPSREALEELTRERAQDIAAEGARRARELGFEVETRVERCGPATWQTILDVADELDATLIVSGTHGTTAVESAILGSVSNGVVHHSHRPVLIVPTARVPAAGMST